jgi:uncharacterized protein YaiI (UPF0178 family)
MWLLDGSNLLGALRVDRHAPESKRELARLAASFARAKRARVTLFFDGNEPPSFARHLGNTTIVFAGTRKADDLIAEQASAARDAHVVTSDRGLAARVGGRRVEVVDSREFLRDLEQLQTSPESTSADDWADYFSDPKNRGNF